MYAERRDRVTPDMEEHISYFQNPKKILQMSPPFKGFIEQLTDAGPAKQKAGHGEQHSGSNGTHAQEPATGRMSVKEFMQTE